VDDYHDWFLMNTVADSTLWIVNIHGYGSHGDQLYTRPDIREHFLPQFKKYHANILTPNLRNSVYMCPAAVADLHDLLQYISGTYGARTFVFFSGSMGGTSNLIYAIHHPEDVAGMAVLGAVTDLAAHYHRIKKRDHPLSRAIVQDIAAAYGGSPDENPELYARHSVIQHTDRLTMPVYYTHGEKDEMILVEQARDLANRMKGFKNFLYQEIPGGDHDSALWETKALEFIMRKVRI
jgi:pimeloyl-ACP methyl ester carboxylesterase